MSMRRSPTRILSRYDRRVCTATYALVGGVTRRMKNENLRLPLTVVPRIDLYVFFFTNSRYLHIQKGTSRVTAAFASNPVSICLEAGIL
ncbi:hypothetical protein K435DRAFT_149198 [Dendrothele bispora CBS 962.96]|uniref:Uncharacterized protein n=1 Tax=Dendrothele bispora (strain CBS 962.96) TaxID=1314807 RepID=A0A4S8MPK9_DENBC|nr:hypothetical protein K435DRAFT_149198 [Dendrothele bispora CBS 962.96]